MQLEPYLFFHGNAEEALTFYCDVFGGEITALNRYEGSPMEAEVDDKRQVMHASFRAPGVAFMAADSSRHNAQTGNISMSLGSSDVAESQRVFDKLAQGGTVTMPFGETFWGAKFGMLTDRFGIDWMVNCAAD